MKYGKSEAELIFDMLETVRKAQEPPVEEKSRSAFLGAPERDVRQYSITQAIKNRLDQCQDKKLHGIEEEWHKELVSRGFDIPLDCIGVPMDVLTYSPGGSSRVLQAVPNFLVGVSTPQELPFIDMLRNASLLYQSGAQELLELRDNVAIPRQLTDPTVTWLTPGGSVTAGEGTYGQISATPKTAIAITEVSEQLLRQSSSDRIINAGLAQVMAVQGIDNAGINGTGGAQPLGILNTPGIGTVSGGSLAYATLVGVQKTVANANAIINRMGLGYAASPVDAEIAKGRQRFTGTDSPLWRGALHAGEIEGVRALSSKQLTAGTMIYGDWSTVWIGYWGPLMLATDRGGTRFNQALVGIRAMMMLDVFITSPTSFVKITGVT